VSPRKLAGPSRDAVVVTVGMTIATLSDLNFGTVIKGVPRPCSPRGNGR